MMKTKLTNREQEALTWARSSYRNWRKHLDESLSEHMAAMPAHMKLPDFYPVKARQEKIETWRYWYFRPFGDNRWNVNTMIIRRLLREKRV